MRSARIAIAGGALLLFAACGGEDSEPRFPVGQGWVVEYEQSPDLRYDWDGDRIVEGSVRVVLADGTTTVIGVDTDLRGRCQAVLPPPAVSGPCWFQVGSMGDTGQVEWAASLGLIGDSGQPETINQDHSFYDAVRAGGGRVVEVTGDWIVFSTGRVVARGPTDPAFEPFPAVHDRLSECPVDTLDDLPQATESSIRYSAILDVDSGDAIVLQCWRET